VRWSAPGVVAAARAEKLPIDEDRAADLARGGHDGALDYAAVAATVAVRRHARSQRDLRDVRLVVASGGVFRHASRERAIGALEATVHDHAGGWALPRAPLITVDADYVLAPAGLLADDHRDAAVGLLRAHLHVR
jgi:hypothetical protein